MDKFILEKLAESVRHIGEILIAVSLLHILFGF